MHVFKGLFDRPPMFIRSFTDDIDLSGLDAVCKETLWEASLDIPGVLQPHTVVSTTPCGFYINRPGWTEYLQEQYGTKRLQWVGSNSRKFHPTKRAALYSLLCRRSSYVRHCKRRLFDAEQTLKEVEEIQKRVSASTSQERSLSKRSEALEDVVTPGTVPGVREEEKREGREAR